MNSAFSYIYSIPYIILFLVFFICFLKEDKGGNNIKSKNKEYIICILSFIFFFAFRGYMDTDFSIYYPIYEKTPPLYEWGRVLDYFQTNDFYISRLELGFKCYLILLRTISNDYFIVQIVTCVINVVLIHKIFKRYSLNKGLSFALFLVFNGIIIEFNLIRNSLALLLSLYTLRYCQEGKMRKFIIYNVIACFFHFSSVFFLPLYFLRKRIISKNAIWWTFAIGTLCYLSQIQYITSFLAMIVSLLGGTLANRFELYSQNELYNESYGITLGFIERAFTYIVLFANYPRLYKKSSNPIVINTLFWMLYIYFIVNSFMYEFSIFVDRVALLFIAFYWLLYPNLYYSLSRGQKHKFILILLVFGIFKMARSNNFIIRQYQNILVQHVDIEDAYKRLNTYHLYKD